MPQYIFRDSRYASHSKIVNFAGAPPSENATQCIDIGCASGYLSEILNSNGWEVTGVDVNISEIANRDKNGGVQYLEADFMQMNVAEFASYFDLVLAGDVIEHIVDTRVALSRISYLMKSQARLIISIPNIVNVFTRLQILFGQFNYQDKGPLDKTHVKFFTKQSLNRTLGESGFEVIAKTYTGLPIYIYISPKFSLISNFLMEISQFLANLWPSLFAYQFVLVCQITNASKK